MNDSELNDLKKKFTSLNNAMLEIAVLVREGAIRNFLDDQTMTTDSLFDRLETVITQLRQNEI